MLKTLSLYLASAIGLMRMFQKAGYFDKKLAFVPILNEYLVFRLAGEQRNFFYTWSAVWHPGCCILTGH